MSAVWKACALSLFLSLQVSAAEVAPQGAAAAEDIAVQLSRVPGLHVLAERPSPFPGSRFFILVLEVPADHRRPEGERLPLRMTLLHRSASAPMVLGNSGYWLSTGASQRELTYLLQANQLNLEHRFFGGSFPESMDWSLLDTTQAAFDHHAVVQALRPLYGGRWVSTGGSKGGMTALFHRMHFPEDVDATVAYVAPYLLTLQDPAYPRFFEQVGTPECRARLDAFQREALRRRDRLEPIIHDWYAWYGYTFELIGMSRAFEIMVHETPFTLWQFHDASLCEYVPGPEADDFEYLYFIDYTAGLVSFSDPVNARFTGYYHQCRTELGFPRYREHHLADLLRYPGENTPASFPPYGVETTFDPSASPRTLAWVRGEAERVMLVYGENDPYSARMHDVNARRDSYRYVVPNGNHYADLHALPDAQREEALATLSRWLGVEALRPETSSLARSSVPAALRAPAAAAYVNEDQQPRHLQPHD